MTDTTQLFALVGGVALLTLVFNGTSSGPVLVKLGLAKSSASRAKLLEDLYQNIRQHMLDEFVKLMSEFRFANVDFAVVRDHIDTIANLTVDELKVAVKRNENVATPCLDNVLPYLSGANGCEESFTWANACYGPNQRRRSTIMGRSLIAVDKKIEMDTVELRHFFLGILKSAYGKMVEHGELDGRDTFVTLVLLDGLAIAATDVDNGKPLQDWETTERLMRKELDHAVRLVFSKRGHPFRKTERTDTIAYQKLRMNVLRALAFIHAHRLALEYFEENIVGSWSSGQFQEAERVVVGEVKGQMKLVSNECSAYCMRNSIMLRIIHRCIVLFLIRLERSLKMPTRKISKYWSRTHFVPFS